jgi:NADPH-dependent glutamate synthase beta subunit-like oxidoreductase
MPSKKPTEAQPRRPFQPWILHWVCIAGGGPAGLMLATLLARKKVPVLLLEQHRNFERDFRRRLSGP